VGSSDGDEVGLLIGDAVGSEVGILVGDDVGLSGGYSVGDEVAVGDPLVIFVGATEGVMVTFVGDEEGTRAIYSYNGLHVIELSGIILGISTYSLVVVKNVGIR